MKYYNLTKNQVDKNFNLLPFVSFFWEHKGMPKTYSYINIGWLHWCLQIKIR